MPILYILDIFIIFDKIKEAVFMKGKFNGNFENK